MAEEQATWPATVIRRGSRIKGGASLIIEDFKVEMARCKNNEMIWSEPFKVKDATFTIFVCPNGLCVEDEGRVSVFLSNVGENDVKVEMMKLTVKDSTREAENLTIKTHKYFGWPWLFSHKKCEAKLVDGAFKVTIEVEMLADRRVLKKYTEVPKLSSQWVLEEMYRNNMQDSDFNLVCGDQKIPCHKNILASASPFFKGMMDPINEHYKEYKEGSVVVQCSEQVGHGFVKFLYTAKIKKTVLEDNYETFLRLADYYQVDQLKLYVEQRMLQSLKRSNMVTFYIAGDVYRAGEIREAAKQLVRDNLDWLRGRRDWREAFGDKKDLIIEIIFD